MTATPGAPFTIAVPDGRLDGSLAPRHVSGYQHRAKAIANGLAEAFPAS
jgi:hypothetical protein